MKEIEYYIVDVFAKNKYEGNQLAVFIDLKDELSGEEMLSMAKEINFAESTFIKQKTDSNKYIVKIFTAESEIPFAGHPTLGTGYIIAKFLMEAPSKEIILQLIDSEIEIKIFNADNIDNSLLQMTQTQPAFLSKFRKEDLSEQLGIEASFIKDDESIQEISTGLPYIIIPIKDLKSMEKIELSPTRFKEFLISNKIYKTNNSSGLSTSLFFFTDQTYKSEHDYNTRMFCLENELLFEDAATGSANGCFLAYLLKFKNEKIKAINEQGFQMNRKSYLYLDGKKLDDKYDIKIGGYTQLIAKGTWIV